jgi:hypothetical protein
MEFFLSQCDPFFFPNIKIYIEPLAGEAERIERSAEATEAREAATTVLPSPVWIFPAQLANN